MAAAERGEAGTILMERATGEGQEAAPLDPQLLEKELLLAREAVNCKYLLCFQKADNYFTLGTVFVLNQKTRVKFVELRSPAGRLCKRNLEIKVVSIANHLGFYLNFQCKQRPKK